MQTFHTQLNVVWHSGYLYLIGILAQQLQQYAPHQEFQ
jgi:hypothetical protein